METLYSASDIVVSRAGALSLAEVSFFGLPSVLIPHPQGGAHQRENAFYLEKQGAAYVFPQPEFNFKEFSNSLDSLVSDQKLRNQFSSKMAKVKGGVRFEEFCRSFSL